MPPGEEPASERACGQVRIVVHLVPGTWSRGPFAGLRKLLGLRPTTAWYDDGSPFLAAVLDVLGREVGIKSGQVRWVRFSWSELNSVRDRARAAKALSQQIADYRRAFPGAAHLAIAHSHGGNIALSVTEKPGPFAELDGFATMATPFLTHRRYGAESKMDVALRLYPAGTMLGFSLGGVLSKLFDGSWGWAIVMAMLIGLTLPALFLLMKADVSETTSVGAPPRRDSPDLVLRAPGDEASLALAASEFVARTTAALWAWWGRPIALLLARGKVVALVLSTTLAAGLITWVLDLAAPRGGLITVWQFVSVLAALHQLAGAAILIPAAASVLVALGPVMLIRSFWEYVQVDSVPSRWEGLVCSIDTPPGRQGQGLVHSIHESPEVRERIGRWLAGRCVSPSIPQMRP